MQRMMLVMMLTAASDGLLGKGLWLEACLHAKEVCKHMDLAPSARQCCARVTAGMTSQASQI